MIKHIRRAAVALTTVFAATHGVSADAKVFNDLFLFGDSYTDTGAYVPLTNGTTAGAYLGQLFGIDLVTSKATTPGTSGVNFAESGARVDVGPTAPNTQPRSLTQQVAEFQAYVQSGKLTFDPNSSLFFLLGGLNDHTRATQAQVGAATLAQVTSLYALGARYFEIALLPSLVPAFTDSAVNLNPEYRVLVPQLQALFPSATFKLSNWGTYYDDILANPQKYGITNTTDACQTGFGVGAPVCANPSQYFYYYSAHPSDAAHRIVGAELYAEALAIPEPASAALMSAGFIGLALLGRRRKPAKREAAPSFSAA